jgi:gluconolactonase
MTFDNEGRLLVCEHVTSSLVRMDPDGTGTAARCSPATTTVAELNSPNDVIVKSDGAIYFSDPTYGRMPGFGLEREQDLPFQGVYRIAPDGGDPQLLIDDFAQPNGLCFTADEKTLYINDTDHAHIRAFDVAQDGTLSGSRVLADGIGSARPVQGRPGRRDEARRARQPVVTGRASSRASGSWSSRPRASTSARSTSRSRSGTSAWGGPDWNWLFVCASTSLFRLRCTVSANRRPLHEVRP